MTRRQLSFLGTVAAVAGTWALMSTPAFTPTKSSAPPLVITAYGGKTPATPYKSAKTPWGEPDLIGVWSSDDTAGIPMSRPQNCNGAAPGTAAGAGRGGGCFGDRLFLTDEEFAQRQRQITQRAKQGDEAAVGPFRFDYARRAFAQTSLIV